MTLPKLMSAPEIHPFETTELEIVRWAKQGMIHQKSIRGRKNYDLNEIIGFAFALNGGWLLDEEEHPAEEECYCDNDYDNEYDV